MVNNGDQEQDYNSEMQIEGVVDNDHDYDLRDQKANYHAKFDTSNWKEWDPNQVNEYMKYLLVQNKYNEKDIDNLMNQVLLKMNITGKVLIKIKENEKLWNQFQHKIENHSFGIWIAIADSLEKL